MHVFIESHMYIVSRLHTRAAEKHVFMAFGKIKTGFRVREKKTRKKQEKKTSALPSCTCKLRLAYTIGVYAHGHSGRKRACFFRPQKHVFMALGKKKTRIWVCKKKTKKNETRFSAALPVCMRKYAAVCVSLYMCHISRIQLCMYTVCEAFYEILYVCFYVLATCTNGIQRPHSPAFATVSDFPANTQLGFSLYFQTR